MSRIVYAYDICITREPKQRHFQISKSQFPIGPIEPRAVAQPYSCRSVVTNHAPQIQQIIT